MAKKTQAGKKAAAKPNPFELKKKSNKKFPLEGKRGGGQAKNVVQARSDAYNKVENGACACQGLLSCIDTDCISLLPAPQRKKTLLVEYKQLRKANTFVDRRFGGASSLYP